MDPLALSVIPVLIGLFILFILGVILPISVYCAQKWAYKCYKELVKINKHLNKLP